jgi:predicted HAD superfamily Cof-like phosphohydrolase
MIPNQAQSLERLAELSRMLDAATQEIAVLDEEAVRAKAAYEVAYAREFLEAVGSMDLRRQIATFETQDENLMAELAQAKVRACKERIRTLGVQIEVGRSLASAHKTQFSAEAVGQYT